jgi:stalled ribosome rescue protein Dom34
MIQNSKQFGVWMDSHHATIVGRENSDDIFTVLAHLKNKEAVNNLVERSESKKRLSLTGKFFKEIAARMTNLINVHVTGTGQVQEQFIKFLAGTPQYKHVIATESTSNRMNDEKLVALVTRHFN